MPKQILFNGFLIKEFGAYIRTRLSSLRQINGTATNVVALIGLAEKGPDNKPVVIEDYRQLISTFGDGPLVRHGLALALGGATRLVAVRIGSGLNAASLDATSIDSSLTAKNYTWEAIEKGTYGNNMSVAVKFVDAYSNNSNSAIGDTKTDEDYIEITIRYNDQKGADYTEVYLFPRFIPRHEQTGFYTANSTNKEWYVLRNRRDGYIREIPKAWLGGFSTKAAFIEAVEALKSNDEDLLTFPSYASTDRVTFPLVLIQETINRGSFQQPASEFVNLTNVDDSIEEMLAAGYVYAPSTVDNIIDHQPFQLAGGVNGDDGTGYYGTGFTFNTADFAEVRDAWVEGLAQVEEEEVNFVQPAYLFNKKNSDNTWTNRYGFFKSIVGPLFVEHVSRQSNTENRKFRTSILGLPYYTNSKSAEFLNATNDISGVVNCDRVQLVAGGFYSSAFSGTVEKFGGDMLASFVTGLHAARPSQDSITFLPVAGIFTDGLEFTWTSSQRRELNSRSLFYVVRRLNTAGAYEYVPANNYTSWTGAPDRGLQLFLTRRIVDEVNTFVYKNLEENFIGRPSYGDLTSQTIADFVGRLLGIKRSAGVIVAYANIEVNANEDSKEVFEIKFDMQPVTEIEFLLIDNNITYSLA